MVGCGKSETGVHLPFVKAAADARHVKTQHMATLAALAVLTLAPQASAQQPATPAVAAKPLSVEKTPIAVIIANPKAKAVLEKLLPDIPRYYARVRRFTLKQIAPFSDGDIDKPMLAQLQSEFDKLD
jgi:hypothetical protein